jgi:ABC-type Mn2+/Zn2+ transport system permease subunit
VFLLYPGLGMGITTRLVALVTTLALVSGCFGYNKSAKRWAYLGDTVLILGGGGVIAGEVLTKDEPCMVSIMTPRCRYEPPFTGAMVAGVILAAAGLFGIVFNATRPNVKTSR